METIWLQLKAAKKRKNSPLSTQRNAKIIEDYPYDKDTPGCLLLGFTETGRPLHIQVSLADTEFAKIITLYEPDEDVWLDYSKRR